MHVIILTAHSPQMVNHLGKPHSVNCVCCLRSMDFINILQLLTIVVLSQCSSPPFVHGIIEYYVIPTENDHVVPCPGEPCHTLNHYASNIPDYTWSDVVVRFLPGNHSLNQSFYVSNISNLQLTSFDPAVSIRTGSVSIHCTSEGNLHFKHTSNIAITDLLFFIKPMLRHYGTLIFNNAINFRIHHVSIQNWKRDSEHYGNSIYIQHAFGKSIISHSEFHELTSSRGAGSLISISSNGNYLLPSIANHLIISNSNFKGAQESAVEIWLQDIRSLFIEISNNFITASEGKGINFATYNSTATVHVTNCTTTHNMYSGLYFEINLPIPNIQIAIENTEISSNVYNQDGGAGIAMIMHKNVERSTFLFFRNVSFVRNEHYGLKSLSSAISLYKVNNVTFVDCTFQSNRGTAIRAFWSDVYMKGHNSFIDNSATEGGAIALLQNSHLIVMNNTEMLFQNNYADDVGGAIFVQNNEQIGGLGTANMITKCSLLLLSTEPYPGYRRATLNITLNFTNNTGLNGGDAIYGEEISLCTLHQLSLSNVMVGLIAVLQGTNIYFNPDKNNSFSLLSSDPLRVCTCTSGKPECTSAFMKLTKYPGERFNISAVVVGENFGTVTGSVYSNFLPLGKYKIAAKLEELQHFQRVSKSAGCTELQYTVLSENVKEVMVLTAKDVTTLHYGSKHIVDEMVDRYNYLGFPRGDILELPVYINITLLPCPLGFMLHSSQHRCVCHSQLEEQGIACNISDQTVHRSGSMWLNASFVGNTTNGYIIHKYCPFDYCKYGDMNINLENPDDQCAFNHSGTLCGGCQEGLSLALGSSQCIPCSNKYLTLLIPFTLAGFILVFLLTFLNLTVSQGTINGLIFYANIVRANQAVFFPPGDTNILTVFIAWLNLDLGIETCFADGLNGYWKTWLQFVFPVYIWIITAIIIIASHHSSMAAKIFGNNSVPVLATLFLLSYAKLLRTIITVLTFTFLDYPDGSRIVVWSYDASISYFSTSHTTLFLIAVGFLSFLLLPYTGILLSKQYLQKHTKYTFLRWIVRMKPFFDAYFGPFKDKHCYWVGILLIIRVVVLLIFALVQDPNISLIAVNIAALMLLSRTVIGDVYKKRYLSIWENSFFINLIIFSLLTLYIRASGGNQAALAYTAVGLTFAQFIAIILYHMLMRRELREVMQRWYVNLSSSKTPDRSRHIDNQQQQKVAARQPTQSVIALHELREPLLTD